MFSKSQIVFRSQSTNRTLRERRLSAVTLSLKWISDMTPSTSMPYETMCFIAGLVWLVNGLHSRPDDRNYARNLVTCCLPTVGDVYTTNMTTLWPCRTSDGSMGELYPEEGEDDIRFMSHRAHHIAHGIVFFKPLQLPPDVPMPRLQSGYLSLII